MANMIQGGGDQAGDESQHIEQIKQMLKTIKEDDILGYFAVELANLELAAKSREHETNTEQTNTTSTSEEIFLKRNLIERG